MWALAKLKVEDAPDLVRVLSEAAKAKMRDFNSQGIANTMWALATLKVKDAPDLVRALSQAAKAKMRDFNSQGIANTMWALATLKVEDAPDLVRALSAAQAATLNTKDGSLPLYIQLDDWFRTRCHSAVMPDLSFWHLS